MKTYGIMLTVWLIADMLLSHLSINGTIAAMLVASFFGYIGSKSK